MAAKKRQTRGSAGRESKEKKLSLNQKLLKAMAHPMRVQILDLMNEREWSPRELQIELDEGLSQVSYHVKVLRDFELIEGTKTEPRRGAVEHYYRAMERAFFPSGMARCIPKSAQRIIGNGILEKIDKDVGASLKSGKFYEREDWHASWTPLDLDGQGCQDAEELCDEFVKRYLALGGQTTQRRANGEGDGEHIWTTAAVLVFGSEHGKTEATPTKKKPKRQRKKRA